VRISQPADDKETTMFRNLLIPVDLTPKNDKAVREAIDLAQASKGKITLLHVIETIEDAPFEELESFYKRLEESAFERMEKVGTAVRDAGVACTQQVIYGKRAKEIVRFAAANEFDLIVLSSEQLDPEGASEAWASISHTVALVARVPVLLVK